MPETSPQRPSVPSQENGPAGEATLQFYQQDGGTCPYLPERTSGSIFTWPAALSERQLEVLLDHGFRRSGTLLYRAECGTCAECISLRVDVEAFTPSGDQLRALKKNRDLQLEVGRPAFSEERLKLYRRFLAGRYPDKASPTAEEFEEFLVAHLGQTFEFRYRLGDVLIGVGLVDVVPSAASSVYFYFDPAHARRSLGTYSALQEIAFCKSTGRRWLHLGYWVRDCRAMTYKERFKPHQLLSRKRGWIASSLWEEDDLHRS